MRITIFGTGYVGLVTGICLADVGHDVLCMDVDQDKVARQQEGEISIYEPGLESMVRANVSAGRLRLTTQAEEVVSFGILQFIAVGTPPDGDGSAGLKYVLAVAETIGQHMTRTRWWSTSPRCRWEPRTGFERPWPRHWRAAVRRSTSMSAPAPNS